MARRTRLAAVLTLAMINVFTLAAGITVARMLPPRLAALKVPTVAAKPVSQAGPGARPGQPARRRCRPTSGLQSALAGPLSASALGPQVSAVVADPAYRQDPLVAEPGPALDARLDHQAGHLRRRARRARPGRHVHHQGGARRHARTASSWSAAAIPPSRCTRSRPGQYPRPATLASLADADRDERSRPRARRTVSLGYDDGLYTGPDLAPGWPAAYVSTGNVTPISALEVDQGRLTTAGEPEDDDDPYNLRARTTDPAGMAAAAFAALLTADGIHVTGTPAATKSPARTPEPWPASTRRRCPRSCSRCSRRATT